MTVKESRQGLNIGKGDKGDGMPVTAEMKACMDKACHRQEEIAPGGEMSHGKS